MCLLILQGIRLRSDHTLCLSLDADTYVGRTTYNLDAAQATGAQTAWVSDAIFGFWNLFLQFTEMWQGGDQWKKNVWFSRHVENLSFPISF